MAGIVVSAEARATQPGELVVLKIDTAGIRGEVREVRVRAFDRDIPAFRVLEHEWHALVGIDLGVRPGTYQAVVEATGSGTAEQAVQELDVLPKSFRTRRLSVDDAFVTPPPSVAERIAEEGRLLEHVWASSARTPLWTGPFVRPVADPANSAFGTRSIFNGKPRGQHGGADFLSPAGTPIHAPGAGRIVLARELYFTGNTVIIDHGLGFFSMLAHQSVIDVTEGDLVAAGDVVGKVGATGRVTGAHLHWATRVGGARVDPLAVLAVIK